MKEMLKRNKSNMEEYRNALAFTCNQAFNIFSAFHFFNMHFSLISLTSRKIRFKMF